MREEQIREILSRVNNNRKTLENILGSKTLLNKIIRMMDPVQLDEILLDIAEEIDCEEQIL